MRNWGLANWSLAFIATITIIVLTTNLTHFMELSNLEIAILYYCVLNHLNIQDLKKGRGN